MQRKLEKESRAKMERGGGLERQEIDLKKEEGERVRGRLRGG